MPLEHEIAVKCTHTMGHTGHISAGLLYRGYHISTHYIRSVARMWLVLTPYDTCLHSVLASQTAP